MWKRRNNSMERSTTWEANRTLVNSSRIWLNRIHTSPPPVPTMNQTIPFSEDPF
jgi:hypothetical protein